MYKIIVDSSCDLTPELIKEHGMTAVPFNIIFGEEQFEDRVNLSVPEFYEKLKTAGVMPKTAQVNAHSFIPVMKELLAGGDDVEVIVLPLSSTLSGTCSEAINAAAEVDSQRVHVYDTHCATGQLASLATKLADRIAAGDDLAALEAIIKNYTDNSAGLFAVDTMEYLRKGGRISHMQSMVGGLLNIKPILTLTTDGVVKPFDKAKGSKQAYRKIVDYIKENTHEGIDMVITHSMNEKGAETMKELLEEATGQKVRWVLQMGGVIGTHVGPGALFVSF